MDQHSRKTVVEVGDKSVDVVFVLESKRLPCWVAVCLQAGRLRAEAPTLEEVCRKLMLVLETELYNSCHGTVQKSETAADLRYWIQHRYAVELLR